MRIGMVLARVDLNDGVASHVDTLTANLAAAGHQVTLFTGPVSGAELWGHREASITRNSVVWDRRLNFGSLPAAAASVRKAVRDHPVDLLHAHGLRPLPAVRLACGWRLPVVATAHPSTTSTRDPGPVKAIVLRTVRPLYRPLLPDRAIAASTEMVGWFHDVMGIDPLRVRLIWHGCDTATFRSIATQERVEARRMLGIADDELACAVVARFEEGKRHDTAVAAAAMLAAQGRKVTLILAGSGEPSTNVAAMIRAADPAAMVRLHYHRDFGRIRQAYAASDAILLPSEREAFGLVVAEGMLCGLVPVRTPTGGAIDQIEPGVSGLIFPVGDAAALANHLRWLMDHPAERAAMGRAAAARAAARFGAGVMAEKTANVYRELTDHAAADPRTLVPGPRP